ncbi:MAG: serine/threonine protein kinase [Deltaproteobacteria bacterium]|nr:serine/threonine protein kinase [Deltaproteobacteria bacterium]
MVDERDNHITHVDAYEPTHVEQRLQPGTDVNGYIVEGILGQGGMGTVYSATHAVIGKRAAIKVLRSDVSSSATTVERFVQEARAVNQIGHPNIIDIFDYGTLPDGRAFHLMDLLEGESLRKRLRRGPLHPSEAANVIEGISCALIAAHDKGFIHRDLKPDNVYLINKDDGWPDIKLLDFGLAKLMPEAGQAAFITKTGVMIGTPEYMSPEQARALPVDYRTDIYALGILMFEILAGERPFPSMGGDAFAMLQCHAEEPAPALASVISGLPDEMNQLVDAMLSKEPAARPSLAAVRTVIRRLRSMKLPTKSVAGLEMAAFSNPGMSAQIGIDPARVGAQPVVTTSLPTQPSVPSLKTPEEPPAAPPEAEDIMATTPRRAPRSSSQPPQNSGLAGASGPIHGSTKLGVGAPTKTIQSPLTNAAAPADAQRGGRSWILFGAILAILAGVGLALVLMR